jgi:hypothetical protein
MSELKYEIKRTVGVLGKGSKGWKKELNIISWNGRRAKVDIRDWDEKHEKMSRGITLSKEEVIELKKLLQHIDDSELE